VAAWTWLQGHTAPDGRLAAQYLNPEGNASGQWKAPPRAWLADRLLALASPVIPPPPGGAVTPDSTWKRLEVIPPARWLALPNGRPRLFMEAPAGLAAVSLRLHGGAKCRPPISRMGNKAGYAQAVLRALGLTDGQGADAYVWAEADVDVAALLRCYPDPAMLRRVAEIIRGWANEEPRALWERLRLDRVLRGSRPDAESVAAWFPESDWAYRQGLPDSGFNPSVATGVAYNAGPATWAERCTTLAEYATLAAWTHHGKIGDGLYAGPDRASQSHAPGWTASITAFGLVDRHERLAVGGWPSVAVLSRIPDPSEAASQLGAPGDLSNCVIYMDPPYVGTTGYAHDLPRSQVVALARRYALLGATVAISEATPISMGPGWRTVRLTGERVGQKRTFSKQKEEWLTVYPGRAS
jgi:hypothetical protein